MYSLQQTQSIGVIAHKIVIAPYTSVTTPNDLVAILADSQITVSLQQKLMLALVTLIKEQKRHTALDEPRLMRMFSFHILPPLWVELSLDLNVTKGNVGSFLWSPQLHSSS